MMTENFKKTKLYVGITLLVQSVTFLVLFIMLFAKKRSIANTFLALSAMGGAVGAYLLFLDRADRRSEDDDLDTDALFDDESWYSALEDLPMEEEEDIPADESATEEEFN